MYVYIKAVLAVDQLITVFCCIVLSHTRFVGVGKVEFWCFLVREVLATSPTNGTFPVYGLAWPKHPGILTCPKHKEID
jgi:hypothetical protein